MSKHLFHECIQKYLAKKTRILATHQLQYIKGVDGVILLEQKKVMYFSRYEDLLKYRPEYGELVTTGKSGTEISDDSSIEKSMKRQFSTSSNRVSNGGPQN